MGRYVCLLGHREGMSTVPCHPGKNCKSCGWEEKEQKRRAAMVKDGLTELENGLMGLKLNTGETP